MESIVIYVMDDNEIASSDADSDEEIDPSIVESSNAEPTSNCLEDTVNNEKKHIDKTPEPESNTHTDNWSFNQDSKAAVRKAIASYWNQFSNNPSQSSDYAKRKRKIVTYFETDKPDCLTNMPNEDNRKTKKRKKRQKPEADPDFKQDRLERLSKMSSYAAQRLANESPEQREIRLAKMSVYAAQRLANETSEERALRLARMSAYTARRLASETPEQRTARLQRMSAYAARRKALKKQETVFVDPNNLDEK